MAKNGTVRPCKNARKGTKPSASPALIMKSEQVTANSSADQNRAKLQSWSDHADYKSISFWVPPHIVATPDECIAEVAEAVVRFESEVKSGKLHPVADNDNKL